MTSDTEQRSTVGTDARQLVCFRVYQEDYGIDIAYVSDIYPLEQITQIPKAPDFIEGVINLRGEIIPIIDLRKRFGFPQREKTKKDNRIIVIEIDSKNVGFIVDAVTEVQRISVQRIISPPELIKSATGTQFIENIAILEDESLLIILKVRQLLTESEKMDLITMNTT